MALILLFGGIRSGKSKSALMLAEKRPRLYIATALPKDPETAKRVLAHKRERRGWDTLSSPIPSTAELERVFREKSYKSAVLDCVNMLVANCMENGADPVKTALALAEWLKSRTEISVFVSNEVGLGLVPVNPLARRFTDELGLVNQKLAEAADRVLFCSAGRVLELKG